MRIREMFKVFLFIIFPFLMKFRMSSENFLLEEDMTQLQIKFPCYLTDPLNLRWHCPLEPLASVEAAAQHSEEVEDTEQERSLQEYPAESSEIYPVLPAWFQDKFWSW